MMIKQMLTTVTLLIGLVCGANAMDNSSGPKSKTAIVIHGGAGTILKSKMTPEIEQAYVKALEHALKTGHAILQQGGSSTDAVKATIVTMEDSPLFNAGKGAVFTHDGNNELDASIMVGNDLSAGAIAGVSHIKNPILLADRVRTNSEHVLMAREGAEEFAEEQGFELVDARYFFTQNRWDQLQKILKETPDKMQLSEDEAKNSKFGTVGAVALDQNGVISAGTSTGGMTNKRYARIGDSPIIGAGTYANAHCGISATGHGEYFIRAAVAYDICALVEYKDETIQGAADIVIKEKLKEMGGDGGVIGLDKHGNVMMSFNTSGMYRGAIDVNGNITIEIYQEQ